MAKKKNTDITIRSSAAEYLTYVAATGDALEIKDYIIQGRTIRMRKRRPCA